MNTTRLRNGICMVGAICTLATIVAATDQTTNNIGDIEGQTAVFEHPIAPWGEMTPRKRDSGLRPNPADEFAVVYADVVRTDGAAWKRLFFSELQLEGESYIRFTSLLDGDFQEFDADMATVWGDSTAYFNGDAVMVELVAAPGTRNNRAVLEAVEVNVQEIGAASSLCGICFGSDDRVPSDELFAGRLANPGVCSGTVYNTQSCIVTAGHCIGGSNQVIQFNVPNSSVFCNPLNPPAADQFPIVQVELQNSGVGGDWAVATTGTNSLNQTIYERYGEFRPLAQSVPSSGTVQIWGYGESETCHLNHTQQLSEGPIVGLSSTTINHRADTTGGSSGSGILQNDQIIGIATHCGQPCPFGSNAGTRIDHTALQNAVESLCPSVPLPPMNCCGDSVLLPSGSTNISNLGADTCGDPESLCPGDGDVPADVWFVRQVQCTGQWTITITDADFPAKMAVYAGQQCPTGPNQAIACESSSGQLQVVLDVEQFEVYRIRIGGENGAQGQATIELHCEPDVPDCPADLTGPNDEPDGVVDVFDLLKVIGEWGTCSDPTDCPADLTGPNDEPDGVVDVFDLLKVIGEWGSCD